MRDPELSVVVPAVNSAADLSDCLRALERERGSVELEVLVPNRIGASVSAVIEGSFPWARDLPVEQGATIPAMRARAIAAASGACVAVIEDHVIVPPGWARRMLDAIAEGHEVVGGAIENAATETLLDWAAFLCEYSGALPPLPAGPQPGLVGNNTVYRRELLERYAGVLAEGRWEDRLHDAMRADGVELVCRPDIVVGHKKHYTFWEYFSQRYYYARSFAGMRVEGAPLGRRLAFGAASVGLPALILWRTCRRVLSKGGYGGRLAQSVPLLCLFVTSWGFGELVGYLFGGGRALSKVC